MGLVVFCSGVLITVFLAACWDRRFAIAALAPGTGLFVSLCGGSGTLLLHSLAILVVLFVASRWQMRWRNVAAACGVATVLAYVPAVVWSIQSSRDLETLWKENPAVSLRERLAYEQVALARTRSRPEKAVAKDVLKSNSEPEDSVESVESYLEQQMDPDRVFSRYLRRVRALENLALVHDSYVAAFIEAEGFGMDRMRSAYRPSRYIIDIEGDKPIPVCVPAVADSGDEESWSRYPASSLSSFHATGVVDFLAPIRYGKVGDIDHVQGFRPHAFSYRPEPPREADRPMQILQLELVSLLKHTPPAAYLSENLPRMDELASAKTRPLDDFEAGAIESLRSGENLVVERNAGQVRMVGSIRAMKACLDCHVLAQRGDLLGAFTYRLGTKDLPPEASARN